MIILGDFMEFILNNVYLPLDMEEDQLPFVVCRMLGINYNDIESYKVLKKSVDSRDKKKITFVYSLLINLNRYYEKIKNNPNYRLKAYIEEIELPKCKSEKRPVVIGFGPCGMFASLLLARAKLKPIVIERGKKVEDRLFDIKNFKEKGILDENSNFCFGEGGAGTFSDGKLNTRL